MEDGENLDGQAITLSNIGETGSEKDIRISVRLHFATFSVLFPLFSHQIIY